MTLCNTFRSSPCGVAAIIALFAVAPALAQTAPVVYATPEEVVTACRAANARHDAAGVLDCYSPQMQDAMTKMIMTMIAATPTTLPAGQSPDPQKVAFEARHRLADRQQRSGESRDDFAARLITNLPDKRAFLLDFMQRQAAHASTRPASTQPAPQMSDVTIDPSGNTATAKLSRAEADGRGSTSQVVKFEKIDGSWRLASLMMF